MFKCYEDTFNGKRILHIEEWEDPKTDERPKRHIDFGEAKAEALIDVMDIITEFAATGNRIANSKGVTFQKFNGKWTLIVPFNALKPFSFQQAKADLVTIFRKQIAEFSDGIVINFR